MSIIKPDIDDREYRRLLLDNGLEAVIISDPDTDLSATSLSVGVGYYYDPIETPGLAHFLEHMLFMGTEKYPDENYYQKLISDNGGMCNAYTTDEYTNYYFQIDSEQLMLVLEVFSRFFIDPLLKSDAVNREMNAVDSEHSKNLNNDDWREFQIGKIVIKSSHPYTKFGTGSLKTLKKDDIRDKLLTFYKEHYVAGKMKLVVIGKESVEELELAIRKMFNDVPIGDIKKKPLPSFKFTEKHDIEKALVWVPNKDEETVKLLWCMPQQQPFYSYRPLHYISHLIGHETSGSIYDNLHKKGWITGLNVSEESSDSSGSMLGVKIVLTPVGFDHIHEIVGTTLQYVRDVMKYRKDIYQEIAEKMINYFRFLPKLPLSDYVTSLCQNLQMYPYQYIIASSYLIELPDTNSQHLIEEMISYVRLDNYQVVISSPKIQTHANKEEKWYGIKYGWMSFSPSTVDSALSLPLPNPYRADNVELRETETDSVPIRWDDDTINIWWKQDGDFRQPRVIMEVEWESDIFNHTPLAEATTNLFLTLLTDTFREKWYYLSLAGGDVDIGYHKNGIRFKFNVYRSQLFPVLSDFINNMTLHCTDTNTTFQTRKDEQYRRFLNMKYDMVISQASDLTSSVLLIGHHRPIDLAEATLLVKANDINNLVEQCHEMSLSAVIMGDCRKIDMEKIVPILKVSIIKAVRCSELKKIRHKFPSQLFEDGYNENDSNSAVIYHVPIGYIKKGIMNGWQQRLLCMMFLDLFLSESFYTQLRSQEQLGYIVKARPMMHGDHRLPFYTYACIVQSPNKKSDYLKQRITKFLQKSQKKMRELTDKEFQDAKSSINRQLTKKDLNLEERFRRLSDAVFDENYIFDTKEQLVNALSSFTLNDIISFSDEILSTKHWIFGVNGHSVV